MNFYLRPIWESYILKSNLHKTLMKSKIELDNQKIHYAKIATPLGKHLWLAQSKRGVCWIEFGLSEKQLLQRLSRRWPATSFVKSEKALQKPLAELGEYFAGHRKKFTFKLAPQGTAFQQKVWQAVYRIPFGQITTYQTIANKIGKSKAV